MTRSGSLHCRDRVLGYEAIELQRHDAHEPSTDADMVKLAVAHKTPDRALGDVKPLCNFGNREGGVVWHVLDGRGHFFWGGGSESEV